MGEILAGALHGNDRVLVIGDNNSYSKGRIQSVFKLQVGGVVQTRDCESW